MKFKDSYMIKGKIGFSGLGANPIIKITGNDNIEDIIRDELNLIPTMDKEFDVLVFDKEKNNMGNISDTYHTFNDLYHHRALLFATICNLLPSGVVWKSKLHHDGTMYDGMFICGVNTPDGQATYHYDINPYWDLFDCQELDKAPEFDGHTPEDALNRIYKYGKAIKELNK